MKNNVIPFTQRRLTTASRVEQIVHHARVPRANQWNSWVREKEGCEVCRKPDGKTFIDLTQHNEGNKNDQDNRRKLQNR